MSCLALQSPVTTQMTNVLYGDVPHTGCAVRFCVSSAVISLHETYCTVSSSAVGDREFSESWSPIIIAIIYDSMPEATARA